MTERIHVLVMAKSPVAGQVKTRLCPPCSPDEAAEVAAAALADTLEAVAACRADRKIVALDGPPGPWLPPGFEVHPQCGPTLAARLTAAWTHAGAPGIQLGMDTPQVSAARLDGVLEALAGPADRAVLGRAVDGGWWVIGWGDPGLDPARVFDGLPTSTPQAGQWQAERLRALGYEIHDAGEERDIDTGADLVAVARAAPDTRTAAVARRIGLTDILDRSGAEERLMENGTGAGVDVVRPPGRLADGIGPRRPAALGSEPAHRGPGRGEVPRA